MMTRPSPLLRAGLLDHATTPGGIDAGRQQRLHAFFSKRFLQRVRLDGSMGNPVCG